MFLFHINKGEIYGLIGPNGAGKTTMFNLITNMFLTNIRRNYFFNGEILQVLNRIKLLKRAFVVRFKTFVFFLK